MIIAIGVLGILMALGYANCPVARAAEPILLIHPESIPSPERYAQDLVDCLARIAAELDAERPAVSPRVTAFGDIGAAMDEDIERHKAVAKLWICLEVRDYVMLHKPNPSPERYLQDLLECAQVAEERPCPDAAFVRACLASRGHQVPW
jgi:hypothetical protein